FLGAPQLALGHEPRTNNLGDIKQTQANGGQDVRMSVCRILNIRTSSEAAEINRFHCANVRCEMIVGYARASTDGQTLDSQLAALRQAGAERVFSEKISGAVTDRKALARAIAELWPTGLLTRNPIG